MVISLTAIYFALADSDLMNLFTDLDLLISTVRDFGIFGPLLLISLMTLAIIFNPIPSAPIALTAGAIYGHTMGTVYIVAGAEVGAIVAFLIARWAGYDLVHRYIGETRALQRFSSQNSLTALVFASRLIPFMSFDLVSYAAGLSPIKLWRFAAATLIGLLPVSFALAHFGAQIGDGDYRTIFGILVAIGVLTITPFLIGFSRSGNPGIKPDNGEKKS